MKKPPLSKYREYNNPYIIHIIKLQYVLKDKFTAIKQFCYYYTR